jgi:TRAP-type C4-dicarboxylate transport system permease small subunit
MIDDYFVFRALHRRGRPLRRFVITLLVLLFVAALIYAGAFLSAVFERMH